MGQYRTEFQKTHDRAEIARMIHAGAKQTEIAAALNLSPQLVSKEVKALGKEWRRSTTLSIADHKTQEVERLNFMERLLWESWEKSKEGRRRTQQWVVPGQPTEADPDPRPVPARMSVTTESEPGDPRIMSAILNIVKERCKLLDLYKPIKIGPSLLEKDPSKMTVEERTERLLEILNKYATKPLGARPASTPEADSNAAVD